MKPVITAYDWVPPFAQGLVRDLRVRWALEEAGQPYDVRCLPQGQQKLPEHRGLQPFGQVPTYEQGSLVLFESGAIVLYIAGRWPGLLPADGDARAMAITWVFAALNTIEPPILDYLACTIFEAGEPWAQPRLPRVLKRIDDRLGELSRRLGEREWLDDTRFTAGDLMMISVLRQVASGPLQNHPVLTAYVARGEARPAFQRAHAAQMAGFTGEAPPQSKAWMEQRARAS